MCNAYDPEHSCPLCDGTEDSDSSLQNEADRLAIQYDVAMYESRSEVFRHWVYIADRYPSIVEIPTWEWEW